MTGSGTAISWKPLQLRAWGPLPAEILWLRKEDGTCFCIVSTAVSPREAWTKKEKVPSDTRSGMRYYSFEEKMGHASVPALPQYLPGRRGQRRKRNNT
ncbi:uncharacterized protein RBU33_021824 isoform 1-T1 [Hipposideros larvatus]